MLPASRGHLKTGHQCCCIRSLSSSIGCYCFYDLDGVGNWSGGLGLFELIGSCLNLKESRWICEDAGIYEFFSNRIDELHWLLYAIDTKSRVWLISLSMGSLEFQNFKFLTLDVVRISRGDEIGGQGTCIRGDDDLELLSAGSMNGDLLISDLRDFRVLWNKTKAHEAEILCTALISSHKLVGSGSEDMTIKLWDSRQAEVCSIISGGHTAGVTAISSVDNNYILTGSYDDVVRLFDLRQSCEPVDLQKTDGGVWDFNWSFKYPGHFLMPNCFGGLKRGFLANIVGPYTSWGGGNDDVVIHSSPESPIDVNVNTCVHLIPLVPPDKNEQNLYYAADWFCQDTLVVTSSYYERSLNVLSIAN